MRHLWIIALNTLAEARHNKVLHVASGFAAILIVFSFFMGEVSLYQNAKVVEDVGMATISLLGVFVAIFLGVNSLYRELQLRTIYTIICKPISRFEIMIGKYIGMVMVLTIVVALMTIVLFATTFVLEFQIDYQILPAIGLILVEQFIVAAIAVLFSSFSTPFLSGFFTAGLFLIGRVSHELGEFGGRSKNITFKYFATGAQKFFDLNAFNLRAEVIHHLPIYAEDFWLPVAYGFFAIGLLLFASIIFFSKRDLK